MTVSKVVQESGTLTKSATPGSYRVCLITEGVGSSGVYPREMFTQENADALSGALSFMNHPTNSYRPQDRPAKDIVGRVGAKISIEEHDGLIGFWADYSPSKSKPDDAAFIAEYADVLGLSIFIKAAGYEDENTGRFVIEHLDGSDPYKSVDIVVAAGRGGRFDRALESFRALESARSLEAAPKPPITSVVENQKEGTMDPEKVAAEFFKLVAPRFDAIDTFISESKAAAEKQTVAEADAEAVETEKKAAVKAALESVKLIDDAKDLLPSQRATLLEAAERGEDVAPLIESETAKFTEFKTAFEAEDSVVVGGRVLSEGIKDGVEYAGRVFGD